MDNRTTIAIVVVAAFLVAIAVGVLLKGQSAPQTPAPVDIPAKTVDNTKTAPPPPAPNARHVPDAPTAVDASTMQKTASGLQYADIAVGTGASPQPGGVVTVEYSGFLQSNGKLFDSSYKRPQPFKFLIGKGNVIPGWDEGVATMKVGGKRQLVVPAELGYGQRGTPDGTIPAGATLVFDVELLDVKPPRVGPDKPEALKDSDWQKQPDGLLTHDFTVGTGASPSSGDIVFVEYTGWTTDGKKFDSSYNRMDPIAFPIGQGKVIKGWDEGVMSMKVGGKRQLKIPSELAYGAKGRPPVIPPDSTLVFDVELVDVKPHP